MTAPALLSSPVPTATPSASRVGDAQRAAILIEGMHSDPRISTPVSTATIPEPPSSRATLRLDRATRVLSSNDATVGLSRREFSLTALLAERPRTDVSRSEISKAIWRKDYVKASTTNPVDAYVRLLRRRLAAVGHPTALTTIRSVGYRLDADIRIE